MVRRGTGLYADKARRQTFKKRDQLPALKLLSNNHLLVAVDDPIVVICMWTAPM
jgi:hypothetical protein